MCASEYNEAIQLSLLTTGFLLSCVCGGRDACGSLVDTW